MRQFLRFFPYIAFGASIGLFIACLLNDGYYIEGTNPRAWADGWALLLLGWIGLASGSFSWLANPGLLAAWVLAFMRRPKPSFLAASVALLFMVTFLFQKTVISDEVPNYSRIVGYGTGYWLWIASAAAQAIGSAVAALFARP